MSQPVSCNGGCSQQQSHPAAQSHPTLLLHAPFSLLSPAILFAVPGEAFKVGLQRAYACLSCFGNMSHSLACLFVVEFESAKGAWGHGLAVFGDDMLQDINADHKLPLCCRSGAWRPPSQLRAGRHSCNGMQIMTNGAKRSCSSASRHGRSADCSLCDSIAGCQAASAA